MKERSWPSVTLDPIGGESESREEREGCEGCEGELAPLCASAPLWPTALFKKIQKRLNEPNSKNANPPLNIDDFFNFDFFKK